MATLRLGFVQSASRVGQLPEARRELAVVGRSNVGKSSLLNALSNQKGLARTSKTPGATKLLNVFEVDDLPGRWLVDLPGYGYAKVSANERQRWQSMIEGYLAERESLEMVLLLIDGAVGPTASDQNTYDWLLDQGHEVRVVATKDDKVKASKRQKRRSELAAGLDLAKSEVRWVSAAKGTGIPELRNELYKWFKGTDS